MLFVECKVAFTGCIRHPAKRLNPVVYLHAALLPTIVAELNSRDEIVKVLRCYRKGAVVVFIDGSIYIYAKKLPT